MRELHSNQAIVAKDVLLDGRLALFHERERWLAVADLHFGYELSQRAAGNLFPLWGMQTSETRLDELLRDYQPARLILLGDLVHDLAGAEALCSLVRRLQKDREVVLIAGNHDRNLGSKIDISESWQSAHFHFHHGHCAIETSERIQIIGHHHPAASIADGAGLHLKLPAFVQQKNCWIMPAFSPWAGGATWPERDSSRVWLCSPQRILRMDPPKRAKIPSCSADSASL